MMLSIQLYTVRDEIAKDFAGTLEKLAAIGYRGVEFAGYENLSASEMRKLLDRNGLTAIASHVRLDRLVNNLEEEIAYNLEAGSRYLVLQHNKYETLEDYHNAASLYNKIGEKIRAKGLGFCYHNHSHEFKSFNGQYGLDIIYQNTDPEFLKAELDVCWISKAGVDPAEYIRKYPGRCPLIHLKDRKDSEDIVFAEVGEGILDFKEIITAARQSGADYFLVEQDRCERPSMESAAISYNNLKEMKLI